MSPTSKPSKGQKKPVRTRVSRAARVRAAEELLADLDVLTSLYPEGIDVPAVQDYLGLIPFGAAKVLGIMAEDPRLVTVLRGWTRKHNWCLWPADAGVPLNKLSPQQGRVLTVLCTAARLRGTWPELQISYAEIARKMNFEVAQAQAGRVLSGLSDKGALALIAAPYARAAGRYRLLRSCEQINPQPGAPERRGILPTGEPK